MIKRNVDRYISVYKEPLLFYRTKGLKYGQDLLSLERMSTTPMLLLLLIVE